MFAYRFYDENKKASKYWRDIGTLDAYFEANMDLCQVNPEFNLYDPEWPLRTYQPQAPPAKFVFAEARQPLRTGARLGDCPIGNDVQRAIAIAQRGSPHRDFFYSTCHPGRADGVANLKLVFNKDEEPIDHIFDQRLRAKSDGQSGNARAGQQRFDIDLERVFKRSHARKEHNHENAYAADQSGNGADLLRRTGP